ncbi:hypothetical protein Dsin_028678 [Dipteronia sinensis]|uniref:Endonuclease/exonuclease/phosphatase domain-containing protein n=1 Tax=Dipteronia sinensis TaxID=43782 RepID=A0AAE0DVS6_9ROSI|nr:hypothetical protein Dsin_028678 [Dipteronia sinensis]
MFSRSGNLRFSDSRTEVGGGKRKVELVSKDTTVYGHKKARTSGDHINSVGEHGGEAMFSDQVLSGCVSSVGVTSDLGLPTGGELVKQSYRPVVFLLPAALNDYYVLECSGAWELSSVQHPAFPKAGDQSRCVVPDGNKSGSSSDGSFYGNPDANQRFHSWNILRRLVGMSDLPWVCVGDFNEVLDCSEKLEGVPKNWKLLAGFREALDDCGLEDLGYVGPPFTWCNKHEGDALIQERHDRCIGSLDWKLSFPDFKVSHLDYWRSDHRPILLEFSDSPGDPTEQWRRKLNENIKGLKLELRNAYDNITTGSWKTIQLIESRLDIELETEESYWKQRSRIEWLKYGDRNTRFFHMTATVRKARNKIIGLRGDDGLWYESTADMKRIIFSYFGDLFQSCNPSHSDLSSVLVGVRQKLSSSMSCFLDSVFTGEEIKKAVFQLGATKAPGRDGLPALFYQCDSDLFGVFK